MLATSNIRRRTLLIAALLGGVCLAVVLGVLWWMRPAIPEPPAIDLSGIDPAVVKAVEEAGLAVRQAPRSASAWGRLGQVLAVHGFTDEAGVCFAQAERLDPHEVRWPYYQAHFLTLSDPAAAIPEWRRAAELGGDRYPVARLRLGAALLDLGRIDEAETELRRVLDAEPNNPQALLLLGRTEVAQGKFQESLVQLDLAAKSPSTRKGALTALAAVHRRLGDATAAAKELQLADDLPNDPPMPDPFLEEVGELQRGKKALLRRAEDALKAGRVPEAVQWFQDLIRDYPDTDWAYLRLGRALLQEGDNAGAEKALRAALDRSPDMADVHFYLGVVLYQRGDYRKAAAFFRRAAELKPDHTLAQFNLGECLLKEGDRDGAQKAFRAAVESKPAFSDAHAELAALLARDGRRADAAEEAHETLRLDPANEKAKRVLADLAKP
jgi:tetratricopeptide (TPR) repeat protein